MKPVAPNTVAVCPVVDQLRSRFGCCRALTSKCRSIIDDQHQIFERVAILLDTYRPPCILMIGLPVRVIDTSSLNPLRCMNGALGVDEPFVVRREALEAGQSQDFCMLLSYCPVQLGERSGSSRYVSG